MSSYDGATAGEVETRWQARWDASGAYDASTDAPDGAETFLVLDMFPFPSAAGLHVGHPLGYVATDVAARFARMRGAHVLHALGFDAFGVPAEQYAIGTGRHPARTTTDNIATYRAQTHRLGLGHDPRRSFSTTDPAYYRWTQWIFARIYDAWFDETQDRARPVADLVVQFESGRRTTPRPWADLSPGERADLVDAHRLARRARSTVNWCPGLGTVLADAEVTDGGRSERGDFPVYRRDLVQWELRITAYAGRLLRDLEPLDWPESIKALQRHWITAPMHDWVFSRQRYWGEPFPVVFDEDDRPHLLPDDLLPVTLPELETFAPEPADEHSDPVAPLERATDWVHVTLDLGDGPRRYRRETSTMPQWAGSCWYHLWYLRDVDGVPRFPSREVLDRWTAPTPAKPLGGVDLYVGGAEHAVLHLLYARFWHKVLYDLGHVPSPEPFARLVNQGYVQAWAYRDARGVPVAPADVEETDDGFRNRTDGGVVTRSLGKMGKSLRNSVTPDELVARFGADTFRLHLMSAAPVEVSRVWDTAAVVGSHRFLQRLWRTVVGPDGTSRVADVGVPDDVQAAVDELVREAARGYPALRFNTIQARANAVVTALLRSETTPQAAARGVVAALFPLVPHVCAELWERMGETSPLDRGPFPEPSGAVAPAEVTYPVRVAGRVRGRVTLPADARPDDVERVAVRSVEAWLPAVYRVRVVPGRIVVVEPA